MKIRFMQLTKYENMKKKLRLIFYIARECLYIKEKITVYVFSSFRK